MAGPAFSSGLMALLNGTSGLAQGYYQGNQQNIANQRAQGLLDLQRQKEKLAEQQASSANLQSGVEMDPVSGQARYRSDYAMVDPENKDAKLSPYDTKAQRAATASGLQAKMIEPYKFGDADFQEGVKIPASDYAAVKDAKLKKSIIDMLGGNKSSPQAAAVPQGGPASKDISASEQKLGLPPGTSNAVRSMPMPQGQQGVAYDTLSPGQKAALGYVAPGALSALKGDAEMDIQRSREAREAGNQAAHLGIAKKGQDNQVNQFNTKTQEGAVGNARKLYESNAKGLEGMGTAADEIANMAKENKPGNLDLIKQKLVALVKERPSVQAARGMLDSLPKADTWGNWANMQLNGGKMDPQMQRVILDIAQQGKNNSIKESESYRQKALKQLSSDNARYGLGLSLKQMNDAIVGLDLGSGGGGGGDRVSVIGPNGKKGTLPRAQLKEALSHGYKQAQ